MITFLLGLTSLPVRRVHACYCCCCCCRGEDERDREGERREVHSYSSSWSWRLQIRNSNSSSNDVVGESVKLYDDEVLEVFFFIFLKYIIPWSYKILRIYIYCFFFSQNVRFLENAGPPYPELVPYVTT